MMYVSRHWTEIISGKNGLVDVDVPVTGKSTSYEESPGLVRSVENLKSK